MSFSDLHSGPESLLPNAATSFGLNASGTPDTQSRPERYAKHLAQG
jgi:hypothetical protein